MTNNDQFNYLIKAYANGTLSTVQQKQLFDMVASGNYDPTLSQLLLQELKEGEFDKKASLPPHVSEEIIRNIFKAEKNMVAIMPQQKRLHIGRWIAAACLCGLVLCGYYFMAHQPHARTSSFAALIPDSAILHINNTSATQIVALPDGSTIKLQPQSRVHYPKKFAEDKREVYLEGEAFFEVTKNAQRPFLVYYNHIVTRVLGTSFTINTNPATGNVEVVVKTGKVQVYENDKLVERKEKDNAVIVTPNQKAIYKESNGLFQTTLVEKPEPLLIHETMAMDSSSHEKKPFVYEQEKMLNIFEHLSKTYGIEIVVENANLNNCVFTGDISDNNLYNKLKIICLTINAAYEVNGTAILIKGKGCNE